MQEAEGTTKTDGRRCFLGTCTFRNDGSWNDKLHTVCEVRTSVQAEDCWSLLLPLSPQTRRGWKWHGVASWLPRLHPPTPPLPPTAPSVLQIKLPAGQWPQSVLLSIPETEEARQVRRVYSHGYFQAGRGKKKNGEKLRSGQHHLSDQDSALPARNWLTLELLSGLRTLPFLR